MGPGPHRLSTASRRRSLGGGPHAWLRVALKTRPPDCVSPADILVQPGKDVPAPPPDLLWLTPESPTLSGHLAFHLRQALSGSSVTFVFKRRRCARSPPGQRRCSHVPAPAPHPQAGPIFRTATWPSSPANFKAVPRGSRLSPGPTPLAAAFLLVACHTRDVRGCSHVPPFPPKCQPHWHGFPQRRSVTMFDSASQEDNFMLPGQAVVRQSLGDALDGGSQVRSWYPARLRLRIAPRAEATRQAQRRKGERPRLLFFILPRDTIAKGKQLKR